MDIDTDDMEGMVAPVDGYEVSVENIIDGASSVVSWATRGTFVWGVFCPLFSPKYCVHFVNGGMAPGAGNFTADSVLNVWNVEQGQEFNESGTFCFSEGS